MWKDYNPTGIGLYEFYNGETLHERYFYCFNELQGIIFLFNLYQPLAASLIKKKNKWRFVIIFNHGCKYVVYTC